MIQKPLSATLPFLEHLEELRSRLWRVAAWYTALFSLCAWHAKDLFEILQAPLLDVLPPTSYFIATTAASGWIVYLRIALMGALLGIFPFGLFEFWHFVSPGLQAKERQLAWPLTFLMTVFFFGGLAFAYFLALPWTMAFLVSVYQGSQIHFLPQIEDYLSFSCMTLLGFGLLFELPFLVLMLTQSGLVARTTLAKGRSYVYVLAFIIGAILTPPDVASQIMMSVPFILLFELGLLFGRFGNRPSSD